MSIGQWWNFMQNHLMVLLLITLVLKGILPVNERNFLTIGSLLIGYFVFIKAFVLFKRKWISTKLFISLFWGLSFQFWWHGCYKIQEICLPQPWDLHGLLVSLPFTFLGSLLAYLLVLIQIKRWTGVK